MIDLIFTVGCPGIYEPYLNGDTGAGKASGGSVWRDYESARRCADRNGFNVYGVAARWSVDTEFDPNGAGWHRLKVPAFLRRVDVRA